GAVMLSTKLLFAAGVALLAGGALAARERPVLVVPSGETAPEIDGHLGDALWLAPVARTGAFVDDVGAPARPYSDARIARAGDYLFVALYAADEDVRTLDSFHVTLGDATFDVRPNAELHGAPEGSRAASDLDGTLDKESDDDEEWVIELAVPLRSIGLRGR